MEVLRLQRPLVCLCLQAGWLELKSYTRSPTLQKEAGFRVQPASCPAEFTEEVAGLFSSVRVFQSVAQQLPQVYQYLNLELPVGERIGKRECIGDVSECGNNVMIRNGG